MQTIRTLVVVMLFTLVAAAVIVPVVQAQSVDAPRIQAETPPDEATDPLPNVQVADAAGFLGLLLTISAFFKDKFKTQDGTTAILVFVVGLVLFLIANINVLLPNASPWIGYILVYIELYFAGMGTPPLVTNMGAKIMGNYFTGHWSN